MTEKKYLRKGKIFYFTQSWLNEKPRIDCYDYTTFNNGKVISIFKNYENVVGYGILSITKDNFVHLWGMKINHKHLERYQESKKNNLLKIITH